MIVTLDTEYSALYQPTGVAPLVCLSYCTSDDPERARVVGPSEAVDLWRAWIVDPDVTIVGHGVANDAAVLTQAASGDTRPGFGSAWADTFAAYDAHRVRCTAVRQRLLGVALDDITREDARLSTVARHLLGEQCGAEKKAPKAALALLREAVPYADWPADVLAATPWRFKFDLLRATPIEGWPADALDYVRSDALLPRRIFERQSEIAGGDWITNERERTRAALDLHVLAIPGWLTDRPRVRRLLALYSKLIDQCTRYTIAAGIVRETVVWAHKPDHPGHRTERSVDTKHVQLLVYQALGEETPLAKAARKRGMEPSSCTPEQHLAHAARDRGAIGKAIVARGGAPLDFVDAIAAAENDTLGQLLEASGDAELNAYRTGEYAKKLVTSFLLNYDTDKRVRTSYSELVATGRTSARGSKSAYSINIQNQPTDRGKPQEYQLRGCVVPGEDRVLVGSDYGQIELCALGHLFTLVGRAHTGDPTYESTLARAINDGEDCHVKVASGLVGISYAEGLALHAAEDPHFGLMRKTAKPVNFGPPGGMGARAFVDFALTAYDVVFTLAESKAAIALWKATWVEAPWYFAQINDACRAGGGLATIRQLYSGRVRGRCHYTAACNTLFQGLAADGALEALRLIIGACYREPAAFASMLGAYPPETRAACIAAAATLRAAGFLPIAFVHDEFVGEQDDPLIFLRDQYPTKAARWGLYHAAKKRAKERREDELDALVIARAEAAMHALSALMRAGMMQYIPDVAIRTDGKVFPDRWGK